MIAFPKVLVLSMFAVLVFTVTSCVTPTAGIETVEMTEQEDIPVPRSFELRRSYSPKVAVDASFRSWVGEYVGPLDLGKATSGFLGDMQAHRWQLREIEPLSRDSKRLHFDKDDESATVEIVRRLDSQEGGFVTAVKIKVGPRGPEELTVEEHLKLKQAVLRPVRFSHQGEDESPARVEPAMERGDADVDPGAEVLEPQARRDAAGARKARSPASGASRRPAVQEVEHFEEVSN